MPLRQKLTNNLNELFSADDCRQFIYDFNDKVPLFLSVKLRAGERYLYFIKQTIST